MMFAVIGGVGIALIPKVASTTLRNFSCREVGFGEFKVCKERVAFIRCPFDRLQSAYCFFRGLRDKNDLYNNLTYNSLISWESFVDYILINKDEHWNPQSQTIPLDLLTKVYDVETLISGTHGLFKSLPISNASNRVVLPDYKIDELTNLYKQDIELRSLNGFYS